MVERPSAEIFDQALRELASLELTPPKPQGKGVVVYGGSGNKFGRVETHGLEVAVEVHADATDTTFDQIVADVPSAPRLKVLILLVRRLRIEEPSSQDANLAQKWKEILDKTSGAADLLPATIRVIGWILATLHAGR